jgi:hypothetical protein
MLATSQSRPYETFDEIATFNNAHVLAGQAAHRTYRYGSIDTFLQWAAIVGYDYLTVTGAAYSHLTYSNNVPQSWNDPLLAQQKKTWSGIDYNYFRGVDDRSPIFISRQIHLAFMYSSILLSVTYLIAALGSRAVYVAIPLLLLTVDPVTYYQAAQSLPNAINAVMTFLIVFFAMLFADRPRIQYIVLSAACFAIGLNFKVDIVVVGSAIGFALVLTLIRGGTILALVSGLRAALAFGVTFIATNPFLLADLGYFVATANMMVRSQMSDLHRDGYILLNIKFLAQALDRSLLWNGAGLGVALAIAFAFSCIIGAAVRRFRAFGVLAIGAATALLSWGAMVFGVYMVFDRYLLDGIGAFLATVAMGLLLADREGFHKTARVTVGVVTTIFIVHAITQANQSYAIYGNLNAGGGFHPAQSRNLASLYAVKSIKDRAFSQTVLVDQHAYIDLLPFRLAGLNAQYVNVLNLETTIDALPPDSRYLIVFGNGDDTAADGQWPPELIEAYAAYQKRLAQYPVVWHYDGPRQRLLSIIPVEFTAADEMTVSVISKP